MIKSLFSVKATPDNFIKELYQKDIDKSTIEKIVNDQGFNLNYQDKNGNGFLHLCILNNKFQSAKWLIEKSGIDLSLTNGKNQDALVMAVDKNNYLIVDILMKTNKLDINQLDHENRSLLQNAVISGNKETALRLLQNNIDVNTTDINNRNVIFDAVSYGDDDFTSKILDIEGIELNNIDKDGETILHKEEIIENEVICEKLLKKGADPTICDDGGKNFLYHCAVKGMEGSRLLDIALEHGGNINARVKNNNSVLMETLKVFYQISPNEVERRNSLLQMASKLVLKGIDIDAINDDGESGLFDAVRNNDYDVCAFFINQGSAVNIKNKNNETPLSIAALMGIEYLDIILLLLNYKADPTITLTNNMTILEILNLVILQSRGFKEIEDLELKELAKPNKEYFMVLKEILSHSKFNVQVITSKGQPVFFTPILCGDDGLFNLYMNNNFDVNQLDNNDLNIFYVYVFTVFSENEYFDSFRSVISIMIRNGVDLNLRDSDGKHVFSKVIRSDINIKLYNDLLSLARFNYLLKDKQGRTVMHHAVMSKNIALVKLIHARNQDVINIYDGYGILPLTYAALTQDFEMVKMLLNFGNVYIKSNMTIIQAIRKKFANMVDNIDTLTYKVDNADLLRKINILIDQIKQDFKVEK